MVNYVLMAFIITYGVLFNALISALTLNLKMRQIRLPLSAITQ